MALIGERQIGPAQKGIGISGVWKMKTEYILIEFAVNLRLNNLLLLHQSNGWNRLPPEMSIASNNFRLFFFCLESQRISTPTETAPTYAFARLMHFQQFNYVISPRQIVISPVIEKLLSNP